MWYVNRIVPGISANDRAAGGLLDRLTSLGLDFGSHFWISSQRDAATDNWAEKAGIRIIRYEAHNDAEHASCIKSILQHIQKYAPSEPIPQPIAPSPDRDVGEILPPELLAKEMPEEIRYQLNRASSEILASDSPPFKMFSEFCAKYRRPIHYSWDVSISPPDNKLFGYSLLEEIGAGAFGTVYRAEAPDGQVVAIKLLKQEVRADERMLGSFRRGVASMKILSKYNIDRMVPLYEAFELPPCVIMNYIEGDTLEKLIESSLIFEIDDILVVAEQVAETVNTAHGLPEKVLHRDIRPSNIMLRDFYNPDNQNIDVVVLDFDLSWHRNALEKSISTHATTALGYLAPEQIAKSSKFSTRNTAVDSYGLAMTIFFMIGQEHPVAGDAQAANWSDRVQRRARARPHQHWGCVSRRLARLISAATAYDQSERPEFSRFTDELRTLRRLCQSYDTDSAAIWAEELFCSALPSKPYEWDDLSNKLSSQFASGVEVALTGDEIDRIVKLELQYAATGAETRKNVAKYLPDAMSKTEKNLSACGWNVTGSQRSAGAAKVMAEIEAGAIVAKKNEITKAIESLAQAFEFK